VITGLGHVAYRVSDMDRSLDFYCRVLGLSELARLNKDDGSLWLIYLHVGSGTILELFPGGEEDPPIPGPRARGYAHLSLHVDDLVASLAEWRSRGLVADGEPKRGADGNLGFWVTDPDGVRIEMMELAPDGLQGSALRRIS
jgi:lactoylglutathione lyase